MFVTKSESITRVYDRKVAYYYDLMYSSKDYTKEVEFIMAANPGAKRILDVGCGSGTHSILLSERNLDCVVGIDFSSPMITMAQAKVQDRNNVKFEVKSVDELEESEFDTIISMFNVVNHILHLDDLAQLFKTIKMKLNKDGVFIFDCWNGIAAILDPPRPQTEVRFDNGLTQIVTENHPTVDIMESLVSMPIRVSIRKENVLIDKFGYVLKHVLWTPKILKDLALGVGFQNVKICAPYDIIKNANKNNYKLVFVCKA